MTSKLTARLSDGTEWEVDGKWAADGPGCVRCSLKPLKPSPPKEVYVSYGAGRVWNVEEYDFSNEGGYPARRYVLAEEPKAKPQPREWWCVYDHNLTMSAMFASKEAAFRHYNIAKIDRDFPFLVREVLPHGQDKADS